MNKAKKGGGEGWVGLEMGSQRLGKDKGSATISSRGLKGFNKFDGGKANSHSYLPYTDTDRELQRVSV